MIQYNCNVKQCMIKQIDIVALSHKRMEEQKEIRMCQKTNTTESKQGEESTDVSGRQKAIVTETK